MSRISAGSFVFIMIFFVGITGCMTKACISPFFTFVTESSNCPTHKEYHYDMNYHLYHDKKTKGIKHDGYKHWEPHKMPKEDKHRKQPIRREKNTYLEYVERLKKQRGRR